MAKQCFISCRHLTLNPPVLGGDHLFPIIMHNHKSDRGRRQRDQWGQAIPKVPKDDNQPAGHRVGCLVVPPPGHLQEGAKIMAGQIQCACYRYRSGECCRGNAGAQRGGFEPSRRGR